MAFVKAKVNVRLAISLVLIIMLSLSVKVYADDTIAYSHGNRTIVYLNNYQNMGLVDGNGNLLTPDRNYDAIIMDDYVEDHFIVSVLSDEKDERGTPISKYGLIDNNGKELFEPIYDSLSILRENRIRLIDNVNNLVAVYDYNGNAIIPFDLGYNSIEKIEGHEMINNYGYNYDYKLFKVKKNDKYGLVDINGINITDIEYDKIDGYFTHPMSAVKVKKDGYYGYVNREGVEIIPLIYKGINYNRGYLIAQNDDVKFALLTTETEQLLPFEYERILIYGYDRQITVDKNSKRYEYDPNSGELIFLKDLDYETITYDVQGYSWAQADINNLNASHAFKKEVFMNLNEKISLNEFNYLLVRTLEILQGTDIELNSTINMTDTVEVYALKAEAVGLELSNGTEPNDPNSLVTYGQALKSILKILNTSGYGLNDFTSGTGYSALEFTELITNEQALHMINRAIISTSEKKDISLIDFYDIDLREDPDFIEMMSKYGSTQNDWNVVVGIDMKGFTYYPLTAKRQETYDVRVSINRDGSVSFSYMHYNETIKSIITDFMNYIYPMQNGYSDALKRMFQDIESTKMYGDITGEMYYATSLIDDLDVEIGNTSIRYNEAGYFTANFIFND